MSIFLPLAGLCSFLHWAFYKSIDRLATELPLLLSRQLEGSDWTVESSAPQGKLSFRMGAYITVRKISAQKGSGPLPESKFKAEAIDLTLNLSWADLMGLIPHSFGMGSQATGEEAQNTLHKKLQLLPKGIEIKSIALSYSDSSTSCTLKANQNLISPAQQFLSFREALFSCNTLPNLKNHLAFDNLLNNISQKKVSGSVQYFSAARKWQLVVLDEGTDIPTGQQMRVVAATFLPETKSFLWESELPSSWTKISKRNAQANIMGVRLKLAGKYMKSEGISFKGNASFDEAEFWIPLLAHLPIKSYDFEADFNGQINLTTNTTEIKAFKFSFEGIENKNSPDGSFLANLKITPISPESDSSQTGNSWNLAAKIDPFSLDCQQLASYQDGVLFYEIAKHSLKGQITFGLESQMQYNPRAPQKSVDWNGNISQLNIDCIAEKTEYVTNQFRRKFKKHFEDKFNAPGHQNSRKNQLPLNLKEYSSALINSVIAAEDAAFWRHEGFDKIAFMEAMDLNFEKQKVYSGGSTITMQLIKNLYFNGVDTASRKIQEIILAKLISQSVPKEEILQKYLSIVELGREIYGVQMAANIYFNTIPGALTWEESVFLASLLPSPKKRSSMFCRQSLTDTYREFMSIFADRLVKLSLISLERHAKLVDWNLAFNDDPLDINYACKTGLYSERRYQ